MPFSSISSFFSRLPSWARYLLPLMLLAMMPILLEPFRVSILGKFLAYAIAAVALNLIWGYTGILSLGHGVFFALGGYCMAFYLKLQNGELPDFMSWSGLTEIPGFLALFRHAWFALPMIVILPGLFAFLVGLPTFRSGIKGVYFTILSQALALAVSILFVGQQPFTGGSNGITNFRGFFGISTRSDTMIYAMYFVTLLFLAAVVAFSIWLLRTKTGRVLMAIRDGENRLRFLGYDPNGYKLAVFTLSGALSGLAGALFVPQAGIISPSSMGILPSVEIAIWVAVGGRGTLLGPVLGALVVNVAKTFFSESFPDVWLYFLGALFIGTVLFFPDGLLGLWNRFVQKRKEHRSRHPMTSPADTPEVHHE